MDENSVEFEKEHEYWNSKTSHKRPSHIEKDYEKRQASKFTPKIKRGPISVKDCMNSYENFRLFLKQNFRQKSIIYHLYHFGEGIQSDFYRHYVNNVQDGVRHYNNFNKYIGKMIKFGVISCRDNLAGKGKCIWLSQEAKEFWKRYEKEEISKK